MSQKLVLAVMVLAVCLSAANAFLGFGKTKNGCYPDPCKNKGVCTLDAKDKTNATAICTCPEFVYGKHCEHKSPCASKPCRKGVCIPDLKNYNNHTCKCHQNFVGPKCDMADPCARNPCQNGAKCSMDAKFKANCTCSVGWGSKKCEKRQCDIIEFKGKNFLKTPKVYIDQRVEKHFHDLDALCKICEVKIIPLKSFYIAANQKSPFDVHTAAYLAGCGLQFEVADNDGKMICNGICMEKNPIPVKGARCLVDGLKAIGLQHSYMKGGHIHSGCHLGPLNAYNTHKDSHQIGCKEKKF